MGNINGKKFSFTGLFPIKENADLGSLRSHLRTLDQHPNGSPLSAVRMIHMARLVIVEALPFQGEPAAFDQLRSRYLVFACAFDGDSVAALVKALADAVPDVVDAIWQHCIGFPGLVRPVATDPDDLAGYFRRCQVDTNLFLADQPDRTVPDILRALRAKQAFAEFLEHYQGEPPARLQKGFEALWRQLASEDPAPGSL